MCSVPPADCRRSVGEGSGASLDGVRLARIRAHRWRWARRDLLSQTDDMSRTLRVAGGQLGPIQRDHTRADVVERMISLLHDAADRECELVVYPELALTTFFPRWFAPDISDFDHWYERSMPNAATAPLYAEAERLGIGFSLGYALLEERGVHTNRWNVMTLVDNKGTEVATFKKVHIPGHDDHDPTRPFQHAERYYFDQSPDGFGVWDAFGARVGMMICNDRRWPESYREMGLQGVEVILCGYNTPIHYAPDPSQDELAGFHNKLVMQAGAYQNGTFVVGVAKGGVEEGVPSLAESVIIASARISPVENASPGPNTFLSRSSSGSIPSASATRSICCSWAQATCGIPYPRTAEAGRVLV